MVAPAASTPLTALPGRPGDGARDLRTDPRIKPGLRAVLAAYGLEARAEPPGLTRVTRR
ncbi:MAG: hypothetical protein ACR2FU_12575 [Streptosporangiaceae bacterium]